MAQSANPVKIVFLALRQTPMILRAFFRQGNQVFWNYGFFLLLQLVACGMLAEKGMVTEGTDKPLQPLVACAVILLSLLAGGVYGTTYGVWNFFRGGVMERYYRSRARFSAVLAYLFARFFIIFTSALLQFALIYYVFDIGKGSNLWIYAAAIAVASVTFVALGFCTVTISRAHFRSYFLSNLFFAFLLVFSGAVRPLKEMDAWAQNLGKLLPSSHAMYIVENAIQANADWDHVIVPFGMMGLWIFLLGAVAVFSFDWLVLERA